MLFLLKIYILFLLLPIYWYKIGLGANFYCLINVMFWNVPVVYAMN